MPAANPLHPIIPQKNGQKLYWENLQGASIGLALANLIEQHRKPILMITPDTLSADRLQEELNFFLSPHLKNHLIFFPDWETLPYDHFSPHQDIISDRLSALFRISQSTQGGIITSISTLMHKLCPREYLHSNVFFIQTGDTLNLDITRKQLEKSGYRCVTQVKEHGEFAVRGAILDLFPMGSHTPFRIDLFDDIVDSIRIFSIDTQRSSEKIQKIELLPAKEFSLTDQTIERFRQQWRIEFSGNPMNCSTYQEISEGICPPGIEYYLPFFFDKTETLFDYLAPDSIIVCLEETHKKSEEFSDEIQTRYEQYSNDLLRPILPPAQLFLTTNDVFQRVNQFANIRIESNDRNNILIPSLNVEHQSARPLHALENFIQTHSGKILFCAETAGRREVLLQLFNSIKLTPTIYSTWHEFFNDKTTQCGITVAPLEEGLYLEEPNIALIAESQLFGKRIMQRRRRKETAQDPEAIIKDLTELQIGAPIVHIDHGVGRYLGLQTLTVNGLLSEFLTIEYADESKLYIPVSSLHLISRYSGMDPEHAPLHRLGTEQWQRAKKKAAEQIKDVAAELLEIYAHRAARPGIACKAPDENYTMFAEAFPFEETPDQARAIEQILQDMQSEKPMDRLVCGDVGFGKTEVAMRAAFLAVQNNKQVVVLVPTTLLAQQHFQNFRDRFADWPIQVDVVSRFKTAKEDINTLKKIAEGKVDIIIGTHKLLQQDIKFKELGLLIIDEEHRFGVQQKERIKALRANIDILTLTATPIPRTLNMAFSGIRDLSLMATPPARRLSVKTFVHEYQDPLIQEAVMREIMRGGQVYFLHNDVDSIERMTNTLMKLIPEARISFAHGQMRERELEQVMSDFYHRRFNVLVCSTIIESGIDIPSANTIIINRADKLGLAQLHQLRGRVGRSHHQAYAYLLIPSRKLLTADAEKRLDAISAHEDLGVGFMLATHDLEIRGAGELLGEGQSGNMHAIGFTLYMDLLSQRVEALKSGKTLETDFDKMIKQGTEIDLQMPALIPEKYLGDVHLRLQFYKRIASTKSVEELDEIQVEMIDRFGLLPDATKSLFEITALKQEAEKLGIVKIEANAKGAKIEFSDKPNVDPMKIITLIQTQPKRFRLEGPQRLRVQWDEHASRLNEIKALVSTLR